MMSAVNEAAASSPAKLPIVILISGAGSNMRALAEQAAAGKLPVAVKAVISDRAAAGGLKIAAQMGIASLALNPQEFASREAFDAALADEIERHAPGLIVLAGFMRILSAAFIQRFRGRILNIHPSLLPKHRGLHTHRRALEAGDAEHGASVHFVTEELDGGPVVIQARVPVLPDDTESSLAARVLQQEHRIYAQAVNLFACGRLRYLDGRVHLDNEELAAPMTVSMAGDI